MTFLSFCCQLLAVVSRFYANLITIQTICFAFTSNQKIAHKPSWLKTISVSPFALLTVVLLVLRDDAHHSTYRQLGAQPGHVCQPSMTTHGGCVPFGHLWYFAMQTLQLHSWGPSEILETKPDQLKTELDNWKPDLKSKGCCHQILMDGYTTHC